MTAMLTDRLAAVSARRRRRLRVTLVVGGALVGALLAWVAAQWLEHVALAAWREARAASGWYVSAIDWIAPLALTAAPACAVVAGVVLAPSRVRLAARLLTAASALAALGAGTAAVGALLHARDGRLGSLVEQAVELGPTWGGAQVSLVGTAVIVLLVWVLDRTGGADDDGDGEPDRS